jgi:hypothetical protein
MTKKSLFIHSLIVFLIAVPLESRAQWSQGHGLENRSISSVVSSGKNLIAGDWDGYVYLSTDSGATWTFRDVVAIPWVCPNCSLIKLPIVTLFANDSEVFAGAGGIDSASVHISTDNGLTWAIRDSAFTQSINCFIMDRGILFAGINGGVYSSSDNGTSWSASNNGLTLSNYDSIYHHPPQVNCLAISGTNLFAGTSFEGAFISNNSGVSWISIDSGLGSRLWIVGMATIGSNIFAADFGDGVFCSSNNGANWSAVNNGLTNQMVNVLIAHDSSLYLGTNIGVFLSTNGGKLWTDISTGTQVDSSGIISLAVCYGYLFAGTSANGVWRYPLSQNNTFVKNDLSPLPSKFVLKQNYPNPFNPATIISYQIPSNSLVKLEVYDMLGRKIETLVNENQHAGAYSATFNAVNLPSGTYFYRIITDNFVQTKKLIVIK